MLPITWNNYNYTPCTTKLSGVILVSLRLSARPSVRPSVCPSVRPSRIPCPLCGVYISGWIHFIFIHLITQLQVCCVPNYLQNFKLLIFGIFLKFVTLTLSCFDLMWITSIGNHGAAWVSLNAGILVVLVPAWISNYIQRLWWNYGIPFGNG